MVATRISRPRDDRSLVSVAIPVYNGQATVADAIRSVLGQTHRHLEVIVVDDGSTDDTWEVLRSFGPAIRAIRQPNAGIAQARNTGLRAAKGHLLALMDADDLCEPERIAVQVRLLEERPDLVLCSSEFSAFDLHGVISERYGEVYYSQCSAAGGGVQGRYSCHGRLDITECLPNRPSIPVEVGTHFGMVYDEMALGNFVHPPTAIFCRSLLDKAGWFDPEIPVMCEWDWLARAARVGAFGFIDRPLLRYRLSASQISSGERAALDSVHVAQRIFARDPDLRARHPARARRLFGDLYAEAAQASAETHPLKGLALLVTSVLRYRTVTRQTPRTFLKLLVPAPLLTLLRLLSEAAELIV